MRVAVLDAATVYEPVCSEAATRSAWACTTTGANCISPATRAGLAAARWRST